MLPLCLTLACQSENVNTESENSKNSPDNAENDIESTENDLNPDYEEYYFNPNQFKVVRREEGFEGNTF